jgi:lysophospholipid acyltransferase (LPLAT)-like uncharacterized protein
VSEPGADEPRGFFDRPGVRRFLGSALIAPYLLLVKATSRIVIDPPDYWERMKRDGPVIFLSWHGQSNMAFPLVPDKRSMAVLISHHPDGQLVAGMANALGYDVISGSGASSRQPTGTGGVAAFRTMQRALRAGQHVAITADIPPEPGRHVSRGVLALARKTGRPLYAMATSTSRRKVLDRVWDKMQINLPFSRVGFAIEGPIDLSDMSVSEDQHAAVLAGSLDRVLEKAVALADGKPI